MISADEPAFYESQIEQDTVVEGEPILEEFGAGDAIPALRSGLFNRVTREVHAVENIGFDLWPGETLSLVGGPVAENRRPDALLLGWLNPGGEIIFNGRRIDTVCG